MTDPPSTGKSNETPDLALYLSSEEENRKLVFILKRELVNAQWDHISLVGDRILEQMEEQKKPQVMIDLSQLEHMGSSMVALLVKIWKQAEAKEGTVAFHSTHDGINQVLDLAGLAKVWTICDERQDALDALGGTTEQTGRNLAPFLVTVSLICTGIAATMLALKLTNNHPIGKTTEQQMQIGAGAVGAILGLWAFFTAHRISKRLGILSAIVCLGLAAFALFTMLN
ncbi:MAG: STAS domain-containing protein [Planctomycetaceae bacterium]|nr:STAS domain-containing protein [Planctomycetaceae bacterium]